MYFKVLSVAVISGLMVKKNTHFAWLVEIIIIIIIIFAYSSISFENEWL